ncbi:MAG: aminotransferase class V-fold PLP-dependent enzyme [candidate division WOR-3 bacterium]
MINEVRSLFPALARFTYLNCAGQGPLNTRAAARIAKILKIYMTRGFLEISEWKEIQQEARTLLSQLLGVSPHELAFTQSTTRGLRVAMEAIPWREGDNVIVQEKAFPALIYPWIHSPVPGLELRWAKGSPLGIADEVRRLVDAKTKAVFVDWVHFVTGEMVDLAALSQMAEERGFYLVVDGTQGLGPLFPDMSRLRIDFWTNSAAKWLLGIEGLSFLYVRQGAMDSLRPGPLGWLSGNYETFSRLFPIPEPVPGAPRYEEGTRPVMLIAGFSESLKIFLEIGKDRVEERVRELTGRLIDALTEKGLHTATPKEPRAGIVSFGPRGDPEEYHRRLRDAGVLVSLREGLIRVSPHFFNTPEEVERILI